MKRLTGFKGEGIHILTLTNSSSFASRRERFSFLWSEMSRSLPEVELPGGQRLAKTRLWHSGVVKCVAEWADVAERYLPLLGRSNEPKL